MGEAWVLQHYLPWPEEIGEKPPLKTILITNSLRIQVRIYLKMTLAQLLWKSHLS
jgi:hypothetical protein